MSDYSELKKRAMDATPGPWYEQDDEDSAAGAVFIMPTSDVWAPPICRITTEANAAYVAAANPSVILELIEDNERLGLELKDFQWGASVEAEAADEARTEVSKLRAENAGLKTGYQAYERVNAELKTENERLRNAAAPLDSVNGDQLPAINSKVLIHLSSCDAWVEHTVVGYYAWEDLGANEYLHRVFIRVRDADGYLNARLLKDVRAVAALGQGEQS